MTAKLTYPEFASESEEANWLYEHREELDDYFEPAEGGLREILLRDHELVLADAFVTVPFSTDEISRVREIAASEGVDPEELICRVVRETLLSKAA